MIVEMGIWTVPKRVWREMKYVQETVECNKVSMFHAMSLERDGLA
jgi:hypothetical protein